MVGYVEQTYIKHARLWLLDHKLTRYVFIMIGFYDPPFNGQLVLIRDEKFIN